MLCCALIVETNKHLNKKTSVAEAVTRETKVPVCFFIYFFFYNPFSRIRFYKESDVVSLEHICLSCSWSQIWFSTLMWEPTLEDPQRDWRRAQTSFSVYYHTQSWWIKRWKRTVSWLTGWLTASSVPKLRLFLITHRKTQQVKSSDERTPVLWDAYLCVRILNQCSGPRRLLQRPCWLSGAFKVKANNGVSLPRIPQAPPRLDRDVDEGWSGSIREFKAETDGE